MTQGPCLTADGRQEREERRAPRTHRQPPVVKDTTQMVSGFIHLRLILLGQREGVFYLGVVLLQTLLQEGLGQEQFPKVI